MIEVICLEDAMELISNCKTIQKKVVGGVVMTELHCKETGKNVVIVDDASGEFGVIHI